jgi:carboxyl-terminal processing protease
MAASSEHSHRSVSPRAPRSAVAMFFTVGLLLCAACGGPGGAGGTVPSPHASQTGSSLRQGQAAAREVLAVIDAYGLHAKEPGWTGQKQKFTDWVDEADSAEGILRALNVALRAGGGLHSRLFRQAEWTQAPGARPTVTVEGQFAVVSVPADGDTEKENRDYATALDEAIQQVRGQVCGWVVDLRPSTGGGVVPGFVGLSSLLPDGPVVARVNRDGVAGSTYSLAGSTLTVAPSAIVPDMEVPYLPFPRVPPSPKITQPVVVLQSISTGSAGEATVVAFKGRPQTRFVGQPTFGASSGNTALVGPFGSIANLTVGVFQDRAGVTYPEEPIPPQTVAAPGEELPAAKAWLQTQRCGAGRG